MTHPKNENIHDQGCYECPCYHSCVKSTYSTCCTSVGKPCHMYATTSALSPTDVLHLQHGHISTETKKRNGTPMPLPHWNSTSSSRPPRDTRYKAQRMRSKKRAGRRRDCKSNKWSLQCSNRPTASNNKAPQRNREAEGQAK